MPVSSYMSKGDMGGFWAAGLVGLFSIKKVVASISTNSFIIYIYTEIVRGAQQSLAACIPGFPREDDHSTAATCGEDETKPRLDLVPSFGK
jgi:hypothetical protein